MKSFIPKHWLCLHAPMYGEKKFRKHIVKFQFCTKCNCPLFIAIWVKGIDYDIKIKQR